MCKKLVMTSDWQLISSQIEGSMRIPYGFQAFPNSVSLG